MFSHIYFARFLDLVRQNGLIVKTYCWFSAFIDQEQATITEHTYLCHHLPH